MTRELNVRITLDEPLQDAWSDEDYKDIIEDSLSNSLDPYGSCNIKIEVHTVTPESANLSCHQLYCEKRIPIANPKEGDCKYYEVNEIYECLYDNGVCPHFEKERRLKCKYYQPKTEKK